MIKHKESGILFIKETGMSNEFMKEIEELVIDKFIRRKNNEA